MRKISASLVINHKYEIDENDPIFKNIEDEELIKLVKMMVFIDVFRDLHEDDILPLIKVTLTD